MNGIFISLRALLAFTLLTGFAYPFAVYFCAAPLFPFEAHGSLVFNEGRLAGSELIGQEFADERYFASRPSATGPQPYNSAASSGSNYGPLNPDHLKAVKDRQARWGVQAPVDLLTTSGSGLDPHISPEAAAWQVPRIARLRGVSEDSVRQLVDRFTESRQFGLLGEPRVNVLRLNRALDSQR